MKKLTNEEQLRQQDAAIAINKLLELLGWHHDGHIVAIASHIKGNVAISYFGSYGKTHNVECEGKALAEWLVKQRGKSRVQFLQMLDRKISQQQQEKQNNEKDTK